MWKHALECIVQVLPVPIIFDDLWCKTLLFLFLLKCVNVFKQIFEKDVRPTSSRDHGVDGEQSIQYRLPVDYSFKNKTKKVPSSTLNTKCYHLVLMKFSADKWLYIVFEWSASDQVVAVAFNAVFASLQPACSHIYR